jgi:hypothetical protein
MVRGESSQLTRRFGPDYVISTPAHQLTRKLDVIDWTTGPYHSELVSKSFQLIGPICVDLPVFSTSTRFDLPRRQH